MDMAATDLIHQGSAKDHGHATVAFHLLSVLAAAPHCALSVVRAKERLCGRHGLITDFRKALAYGQGKGWIRTSRDALSIDLSTRGKKVLEADL
jgi:hypothetical protein